jgi:hypothetical protein
MYFIGLTSRDSFYSGGEIWLYPADGGPARQITKGGSSYSMIVDRTRDGLLVAVRYRSQADFWDGMFAAAGFYPKSSLERRAELVLLRPVKQPAQ